MNQKLSRYNVLMYFVCALKSLASLLPPGAQLFLERIVKLYFSLNAVLLFWYPSWTWDWPKLCDRFPLRAMFGWEVTINMAIVTSLIGECLCLERLYSVSKITFSLRKNKKEWEFYLPIPSRRSLFLDPCMREPGCSLWEKFWVTCARN